MLTAQTSSRWSWSIALAAACVAFPLLSSAKPGRRSDARRSRAPTNRAAFNATGLGKRQPGLVYASVPRQAFMPTSFLTSALITQFGSAPSLDNQHTRFESGIAVVQLPDGARLRSLSCFGSKWSPQKNAGFGVKLEARGLNDQAIEELGRATVVGGDGKRRLDATLDHVVDNFAYGYQLDLNLNVDVRITGCRIGYEPATGGGG